MGFLVLFTVGPRSSDTRNIKFQLLHHPPVKEPGSSEQWLILGLGLEMYNVSLEYLVSSESKRKKNTSKMNVANKGIQELT
jgi:hypothetical protein